MTKRRQISEFIEAKRRKFESNKENGQQPPVVQPAISPVPLAVSKATPRKDDVKKQRNQALILQDEVNFLRKENDTIRLALDKKSVAMGKVLRQNQTYLNRIKQLENEQDNQARDNQFDMLMELHRLRSQVKQDSTKIEKLKNEKREILVLLEKTLAHSERILNKT